ncbi:MAG: hypothetical protein ACTSXX_08600 [Candidatus Baldrarchaeia archaeon]
MAEVKQVIYEVSKGRFLTCKMYFEPDLPVYNPKRTSFDIRIYSGLGLLNGRRGTYLVALKNYPNYPEKKQEKVIFSAHEGCIIYFKYSSGSAKHTYYSLSFFALVCEGEEEREFDVGKGEKVKVKLKNLRILEKLSDEELQELETEILNRGWLVSNYDPVRTLYYYFLKNPPLMTFSSSSDEVDMEEVSEEEALAGWEEVGEVSISEETKEVEEKVEEERKEETEERIEITKDEIEKIVMKHGLKKVRLVVFELPSEYKGAQVKFDLSNRHAIIKFNDEIDITKIRTLRRAFYRILNEMAWRSMVGWVLLRDADMRKLNDVIKALNEELKTERAVYIVESYFPQKVLVQWLSDYIAEVQMRIDEIKEKIEEKAEEVKTVRRLKSELKKMENLLKKLEDEMKFLQSPQ